MGKRQYEIQTVLDDDGTTWYAVQVYRVFRPFGNDKSYWQDVAWCATEQQAQAYIEAKGLSLTDGQWAGLYGLCEAEAGSPRTRHIRTPVAQRLLEKGLIEAGPYYKQYVLTEKGRRVLDALVHAKAPRVPNTLPRP